ncbi:MAG: MBL fold metallo-hydrolase [Actinomycetales bacterium]
MELRRLDDYQSWQVRWGGTSLLIDPWLTDDSVGGSFTRHHTPGFVGADLLEHESIAAVLLCTGVSDHARPHSLKVLTEVSIFGPANAIAVAREAGCTKTIRMRPGVSQVLTCPDGGSVRITATRTGQPLGLIAVGYLIEALDSQGGITGRIWIDPHLPSSRQARALGPLYLVLLPCHAVRALVLPVTAGPRKVAAVAAACAARVVVPTATDPRRDMTAWQRALYRVRGGSEQVQQRLGGECQVVPMAAGDVRRVGPESRQRSARPAPTSPPGSG